MNHHHLSHLLASTLKPTPTHLPLSSACCNKWDRGSDEKIPILYVDHAIDKVAFTFMFWDIDVESTL
jgi:hypothetical protein